MNNEDWRKHIQTAKEIREAVRRHRDHEGRLDCSCNQLWLPVSVVEQLLVEAGELANQLEASDEPLPQGTAHHPKCRLHTCTCGYWIRKKIISVLRGVRS